MPARITHEWFTIEVQQHGNRWGFRVLTREKVCVASLPNAAASRQEAIEAAKHRIDNPLECVK